jgi:hypothetical protein
MSRTETAPFSSAHFVEVPKARKEHSARVFVLVSAAVYAAALLDMHETVSKRPLFHEYNPLAKPFARLPTPAYYASGVALATGVNFLGWKMARSKRWHQIWWVPQAATIAGNLEGFAYTRSRE